MVFRPSLIRLSKHSSSRQWVARQFSDPYVKQRLSDPAAYRSRSAFKLLEIEAQWDNFLTKRDVKAVVDLGAAPGGWSQVVAGKLGYSPHSEYLTPTVPPVRGKGWSLPVEQKESEGDVESTRERAGRSVRGDRRQPASTSTQPFDPLNIDDVDFASQSTPRGKGTIIAVDLLHMEPIPGVQSVMADFLAPETSKVIQGLLIANGCSSQKVDVILSDIAANASGNETHDIQSSLRVCEAVLQFANEHLRTAKEIGRKRGGVIL